MKKTPDNIEIPEIADESPLDLYNGQRIEIDICKVETEVRSLVLDPTNAQDYKHFGSVSRKISSFKTSLDKIGDSLVRPIKEQCKDIDAKRKKVRDRMDALRTEFLSPRVAFDDAELQRQKIVAEACALFQHGHLKVGEFKKPDVDAWDKLLAVVDGYDITEDVFLDQFEFACEARHMAVQTVGMCRSKFIDDEAAMEAGRAAIKKVKDKEAFDRHTEVLAEEAAATAKADEEKAARLAAAPAVEKSAAPAVNEKDKQVFTAPEVETASARAGRVNTAIIKKLKELGLDEVNAKIVVVALYRKQIPHVSTDYSA